MFVFLNTFINVWFFQLLYYMEFLLFYLLLTRLMITLISSDIRISSELNDMV